MSLDNNVKLITGGASAPGLLNDFRKREPSEPGTGVDLDMQVVEECLSKPATVID